MFEKIKTRYISQGQSVELDKDYNRLFLKVIFTLWKDRLFIHSFDTNYLCKLIDPSLNRTDVLNCVNYCTGLTLVQLIDLLRMLETLGLAQRIEAMNLSRTQLTDLTNANRRQLEDFCKIIKGHFFSTFVKGLKVSSGALNSNVTIRRKMSEYRDSQFKACMGLLKRFGISLRTRVRK